MLIFSAKSRRVVDAAVASLSDPHQRAIWRGWVNTHPHVRNPGAPADDGTGPLPNDVLNVILGALEQAASNLRQQRASAKVSEDEVYELDNDLSLIKAVEQSVYRNLEIYAR